MRTVKDMSSITGVSIRTLRYYDEIGLLKPTELTKSGYRLYDDKALEKMQQIMFFRELDIPLTDIKKMLERPDYDKKQILATQKSLLEKKRDRLNGIIELIENVMKGINTISFEAFESEKFSEEDIKQILDYTLKRMQKTALTDQIKLYGSEEKYREYLGSAWEDEKMTDGLVNWYGSKKKAMDAIMQPQRSKEEQQRHQDELTRIHRQFMEAKEKGNIVLEKDGVIRLSKCYKEMFGLEDAKNILLDLAKEYSQPGGFADVIDQQYGGGCAEYIAKAIIHYYQEQDEV